LASSAKSRRVFILGNPAKAEASSTIEELREYASSRCDVVGAELGVDGHTAIRAGAEIIIVLGGDGTLIGVARSLGVAQVPLIGVNIGKLGFLAEFSTEEVKQNFDQAISDDSLIHRRTALSVTVRHNGTWLDAGPAINDCVIQAGPPFRSVSLGICIDGQPLTEFSGDGLIVCTPTGSTGHNLSAGGPIMQPGVDAIIMTPLAPHSLTHRPLVIERSAVIDIDARVVNGGTTAIIDGQVSHPLATGDRVTLRRFDTDVMVVRNPLYPNWHKLVKKLHWGRAPDYD
jgi:NAD+ kinase